MEWIQQAFCLLLGALAVTDRKDRKIPLWPIAAVLCIGFLNLHMQYYRDWKSISGGMGLGAVIWILSRLTNGQIGTGDGLVIMMIGMFEGLRSTLFCICTAFFLAFFGSIFLLCIKSAGRKYKMPFIPYIFIAYILTLCIKAGGNG